MTGKVHKLTKALTSLDLRKLYTAYGILFDIESILPGEYTHDRL